MKSGVMAVRVMCLIVLVGVAQIAPRDAHACGAMLFEEHEERPGGLSDQEVFLALSSNLTLMVVSAGYVDSSGEFAFLLPVRSTPDEVLDGDAALFIALDEGYAPVVQVVDETSGSDGGGGGCGCGSVGGGAPADGGSGEVQVHDRGSTLTYDYVVVGGDDGTSIEAWLTDEGFEIPTSFGSALDAYVDDGWLFLAAKLRAEVSDAALAPLELRFPGAATAELPFGLTAQSLAPTRELSLTLYVLAADMLLPSNFEVVQMTGSGLEATSPTTSNYPEAFTSLIDAQAGGAFVIEASYASFNPDVLTAYYDDAVASGRASEDLPAAESTIEELELVLAEAFATPGRITRLRTELSATQLDDVALAATDAFDVSQYFTVYWQGGATGATEPVNHLADTGASPHGVDPGGPAFSAIVAVSLWGWSRRRRGNAS